MRWFTLLLALVGFAASASAQTVASNPWDRCTTVQVFGGAATASPNTTGTFGTAIGWELTHRAEIEGTAAWFAQRRDTQAFAADLKLLVNLTRPATIVPYLGGGAGLYRGTFDAARSDVPDFYRRRMTGATPISRLSYTDPTAVITGGAHVYFARHFSIKPEATVRFVMDQADSYTVTAVTFAIVYHVEDHLSANRVPER
ncbi:MAG: hypothetical protein EHM55_06895 [Acidobacteria bacterium]|nr:MAG: hypothetical protein EHM55_06895 [Acidobacteriota bacterium]